MQLASSLIEGGMKVYAREQSAYHTPIEETCAVAVCVLPERGHSKSELHYQYTRLERTTEPTERVRNPKR